MRRNLVILIALAIVVVAALSSLFIVDERQKALVLRFGRVVDVKEDPGLAFKMPVVDQVVRYDDRILSRDLDPIEVTPSDDRRLVVDAFARYRITDVERFRQAVGGGGEQAAALRLDNILRAETREVLGTVSSNDILSVDRAALMLRIRNGAIDEANALGLSVIDVRLKRTDLPEANLNATFERMISERQREAEDERARGREAAQRTRAAADRTVVELVSDAERQAEIIRGEADANRNRIYAQAFGADPEFFEFYRSMAAYERSLQSGNTRMVLSPNGEFFSYLRSDNPFEVDVEAAAEELSATDPAESEAEDAPTGDAMPAEETAPAGDADDATGTEGGETGTEGGETAPAEETAPETEAAPADDGASDTAEPEPALEETDG